MSLESICRGDFVRIYRIESALNDLAGVTETATLVSGVEGRIDSSAGNESTAYQQRTAEYSHEMFLTADPNTDPIAKFVFQWWKRVDPNTGESVVFDTPRNLRGVSIEGQGRPGQFKLWIVRLTEHTGRLEIVDQ